jgi:hypothetical protein
MSSTRSPNAVNEFAIDAFCISRELYAVSETDAPGIRAAAIRKGRRCYRQLLQRRESLAFSGDDASTSEMMLQSIEARLEYLCSISSFRRNQWRLRRRSQSVMPEPKILDLRWLGKGLQERGGWGRR